MTGATLPLDGVTGEPAEARCPTCLRSTRLTGRGLLAVHGPVVARCPSGGLTPAQARARLTHAAQPTT